MEHAFIIHRCIDKKNLLSKDLAEILGSNFGHIDMELFKNQFSNKSLKTGSRYKFVRKTLHLPHPATIRSWAGNVVCEPGFLSNVISSLSAKLQLSGETECALILDEMSIRSDTQWDKKKSQFVGNVDYGEIKGEDAENIASNVLVVMAVGLKSPWQKPIAYFLDISNSIVLDICHMLKLARNTLGDMKYFVTPTGDTISWEYIKALYDIQQQDILDIANKLKTKICGICNNIFKKEW